MMDQTTTSSLLEDKSQEYHMVIESLIWLENVSAYFNLDYVWSKKHKLFLEMIMDPCSRKGFLSKR